MRKPLPPDPAEVASKALRAPVPKKLMASGVNGLHPVAAELLKAIGTTKADEEQRVRLDEPTLPKATVSKAQGQKVAEAFDGIVKALESREIRFRKARSKYDPGYFEKGRDRIYLEIEEPVVSVTREPTAAEKRRPNWYARRDIFGGPYPATRSFPRPPTMPEIPVQTSQSSYGYSSPTAASKPYPFWLKHQR